jgi:hypothetical protein
MVALTRTGRGILAGVDDVYDYSGLEARLLRPDRQPSNVARAPLVRSGDLAGLISDHA